MAGGTWTAQNKVRPGAYINFESVATPSTTVGTRGIMTMPLAMSWGPVDTIINLYSADLLNGASLSKIGMTAFDPESLIYREALSHAYLAKLYRIDSGGVKATGAVGNLDVSARYLGTTGNRISVAVIQNGESFDVVTYFNGTERDRQTVPVTAEGLLNNDWVDFSLQEDAQLEAAAGVTLTGGENGSVSSDALTAYLAALDEQQWNTMAFPDETQINKAAVIAYIRNKRENTGKKVQAVLVASDSANYEGIISVEQGYINEAGEEIQPVTFTATVAGMTAAAAVNKSNTYEEIRGAVSIINPIKDEDVEAALTAGKLILTRRQDGVIVVEQDINTYHTFTVSKDRQFSKNRIIRVLDDIGNQVLIRWETAYAGKGNNNAIGRGVFRTDIVSYMNTLQDMQAIQNFDPDTDITVAQGESVDAVVCDLWVQPVDAMEKLYLRVFVGGEA